jgi:3-hydroxyacyl-[acyl-carrier-protein] dehydratase
MRPRAISNRITALDLAGQAIAGERQIEPNDPVFEGHFPGDPVYPGALQIETMGQLGLCLLAALLRRKSSFASGRAPLARAIKIHHAVFREAVHPGDNLLILAKVVEWDEYTGVLAGQLLRGDTVCSLGILEVYFVQA